MTIYYAIGDIHGELAKLNSLHAKIWQSHQTDFPDHDFILVHLGDYIDRGPNSFDVVERLITLEQEFSEQSIKGQVINLKGNHEEMMLDAFHDDGHNYYDFWLEHGGEQTIASYNNAGFDRPPEAHFSWLRELKSFHWDAEARLIFVHAGILPSKFPHDGEAVHLWSRSRQFFDRGDWGNDLPCGTCVVHGHTPTKTGKPDIKGDYARINVDTGACYGASLTAVVLGPDITPRFITS